MALIPALRIGLLNPMRTIIGFLLWLSGLQAFAGCSGATPNLTADSAAYTDVFACYAVAVAGDTINVPAGSATWNNTLTVTKAVSIVGAGSSATIITRGSADAIAINPPSDIPIRVSGIGFTTGSESGSFIVITGSGGWHIANPADPPLFASTKIRIDHNSFTNGEKAIFVSRRIWGLIDHNSFTNGYTPIFVVGNDSWDWTTALCSAFVGSDRVGMPAGTAQALFIEDNIFTVDNSAQRTTRDAIIYIQEGAPVVIRYNTFTSIKTSMNFMTFLLNDHGNQEYYNHNANGTFRGQMLLEFYNNNATCYRCDQFIGRRGGSALIWGNTFTRTNVAGSNYIQLTEEEDWQTVFFSPLDTVWPAEDQIFNTFIWNNTCGGASCAITLGDSSDNPFIQNNRDYFMHAPQASGGHEYFTGRCGAAGRDSDGTMAFNNSGANAYYPYIPYTYPHPLQGALLPAPKNLHLQ